MTRKETTPPSPPPAKRRGAFSEPLFWLVAGIPAATVVAGLYTLWIAHSGSDVPVGSRYVKQGLSVAPDTQREDRARALGIAGVISTKVADGSLRITLQMSPADTSSGTPTPSADTRHTPTQPAPAGSGGTPAATPPAPVAVSSDDVRTPRRLRLVHPSDPNNDLSLHLRPAEDGKGWFANQPVTWSAGTRWHISIEGNDWRLPITGLQAVEAIEGMRFGTQPR